MTRPVWTYEDEFVVSWEGPAQDGGPIVRKVSQVICPTLKDAEEYRDAMMAKRAELKVLADEEDLTQSDWAHQAYWRASKRRYEILHRRITSYETVEGSQRKHEDDHA